MNWGDLHDSKKMASRNGPEHALDSTLADQSADRFIHIWATPNYECISQIRSTAIPEGKDLDYFADNHYEEAKLSLDASPAGHILNIPLWG